VPISLVGAAAKVPQTATATDPLTIVSSVSWRWFLSGDLGLVEAGGPGDGVSTWNDQTANNLDATQIGSGTARPDINATGLNGHGFVAFTKASGHWMEFTTWNPPAPGTSALWFFGVFRPKTYTSGDNLYSGSSTSILRCRMSATSNTIGAANPTSGPVVTFTPNTWYRLENLFNNSTDYCKVGNQTSTPAGTTGNNDAGSGVFRICTDLVTRFGDIDWACLGCTDGDPNGTEKSLLSSWTTSYYGGSVVV